MKKSALLLFLFAAVLGAAGGCGGGGGRPAETTGTQTANNNPPQQQPQPKSAENAAANDFHTGVAVCDDYLSKVEVCLKKPSVPEAVKTSFRQSLEQNRAAWKQASSTAQGRQQLESSCKMAMDAAKTFFDSCK